MNSFRSLLIIKICLGVLACCSLTLGQSLRLTGPATGKNAVCGKSALASLCKQSNFGPAGNVHLKRKSTRAVAINIDIFKPDFTSRKVKNSFEIRNPWAREALCLQTAVENMSAWKISPEYFFKEDFSIVKDR